ncbi:hypothetical protein QWY90_01440 [Flavobacterium paronense]|nr:hypothetical protein [Flavobacterium paronense]MDN3675972.1 hypothetical protein [Flavobacterium paronense]
MKSYNGLLLFLESLGKEGTAFYCIFTKKEWTKTDWLVHMHEAIPLNEQKQVEADLNALAKNFPPQYLLGMLNFMDINF